MESIIREYLKDLQDLYVSFERNGQSTPELSYRPLLNRFFNGISKIVNEDINIVFEPKRQGEAGRPDWLFDDKNTLGIYGYIDSKGLNIQSRF